MTYQTGDHLSVVPRNHDELVNRVLQRFGFSADTQVRLHSSAQEHSQLPVGAPVSVKRLLTETVELQPVASRKDVATLARYTECPKSAPALKALAEDDYKTNVQQKRVSVLELLERFPACELPFGVFLEQMPMMTPRYYSISSSVMLQPGRCSITVVWWTKLQYRVLGSFAVSVPTIWQTARQAPLFRPVCVAQVTASACRMIHLSGHHGWPRHGYRTFPRLLAGTHGDQG